MQHRYAQTRTIEAKLLKSHEREMSDVSGLKPKSTDHAPHPATLYEATAGKADAAARQLDDAVRSCQQAMGKVQAELSGVRPHPWEGEGWQAPQSTG